MPSSNICVSGRGRSQELPMGGCVTVCTSPARTRGGTSPGGCEINIGDGMQGERENKGLAEEAEGSEKNEVDKGEG